ncbi:Nn.00g087280.m01.CDS01 [Neocucurbitaria sp. VM-36]
MRPSQLLAAVLAMSSVSVAISDAFDNIHDLAAVKNVLFGRQDDNSDNASSDAPKSTSAPATTKSDDNKSASSTGKAASGSAKASGSQGTKVTTAKTKATSFDPRLPAGGLSMVTPDALAAAQYYKVGDWVTFAWNYTSLSVTPSAIDVLASCTANQATYTIAVNMSAEQTKVLWDTNNTPDGQAPFLTEKYTLLIYDADLSVSATARAGYLGVYSGFTFGMYTPQPYTPWADFKCANCNGALSQFEKMTIKALLMTTGTTIGSLLYFTYAFGLW